MSARNPSPRLPRAFAVVGVCLAWLLLAASCTASASAAALPSGEADAVHTVNAEGKLSVFGMVSPNGGTVKYWFEFLSEAQFQEGAWASATKTTPVETSAGGLVWQEIPVLPVGEAYHYRLAVEDEAQFKGEPQYSPTVRTLTIPAPEPETQPACPNAAVRTGPSARLPDCRAYEQVTPVNKEGADDIFDYGSLVLAHTVVGIDGEHIIFQRTPTKWGQNVGGSFEGESSYSFARTPAGWAMTSLYPQPQTGGLTLRRETNRTFDTPDLSQVLVEESSNVSNVDSSREVKYAFGPPGGPYTTVASDFVEGEGNEEEHWGHWVAQSRDGSVAVIESPDHELIPGERTGTTKNREFGNYLGNDLYAYSEGRLSQVNAYTDGETIGTCGAEMVEGREGGGNRGQGQEYENLGISLESGSINAVSSNGSRIFFEAYPAGCPSREEQIELRRDDDGSTPKIELYMRLDGKETVDIGNYIFEGANPEGTRVLLSRWGAGGLEYFSYNTETGSTKRLFSLQDDALGDKHALSEDGDVYYFEAIGSPLTPEAPANLSDIYRYDITSETMSFVAVSEQTAGDHNGGFYLSPDGGDFYFNVRSVQGVSGSAQPPPIGETEQGKPVQAYRYDSAEGVVQCVSCASPHDPEPKLLGTFLPEYGPEPFILAPLGSPASENGNFVFFDTPSALVAQDVNGEITPEVTPGEEESSDFFSPSSDVYEWRRYGVDGCGRVQGCLALITNGVDGTQNVLLGVGHSGRDVFIGTHSQLAPTDTDESGDIYDVRIDGGFPAPAPPPTECEGDACSTAALAPGDPTQTLLPALSTSANPPGEVKPKAKVKKKRVGCSRGRVRLRGRCVKRAAKGRVGRRGVKVRRSGRSGR
jgi:hypothetical protein